MEKRCVGNVAERSISDDVGQYVCRHLPEGVGEVGRGGGGCVVVIKTFLVLCFQMRTTKARNEISV